MLNYRIPIKRIGEKDWVKKLKSFLEEFDVEVEPIEDKNLLNITERRLNWQMPTDMKEFYLHFGGICSDDFLYNFKNLEEITPLSNEEWTYVTKKLEERIISDHIVFSESPSNDPICINKTTSEIFLFSHDPLRYSKVYNNFSDYIVAETIALQELLGDLVFEGEEEKMKFMSEILSGDHIDYKFRNLKLE